jgi:hypothetical protein
LDLFWFDFVKRILMSKLLTFFREIVEIGVIFRDKLWVLHTERFGLVVELGDGFRGYKTERWVPLSINLRHIVLLRSKSGHHSWKDITTGKVFTDHLR